MSKTFQPQKGLLQLQEYLCQCVMDVTCRGGGCVAVYVWCTWCGSVVDAGAAQCADMESACHQDTVAVWASHVQRKQLVQKSCNVQLNLHLDELIPN